MYKASSNIQPSKNFIEVAARAYRTRKQKKKKVKVKEEVKTVL